MRSEFGQTYASMIASSHSLAALDERTADEALAQGVSPRHVWEAICDAFDVPAERRLGEDLPIVDHDV